MSDEKSRINCLILAAGFGTRLGSFGEGTPKGLIEMANGETLLGKLVSDLLKQPEINKTHLVTNQRFFVKYRDWINDNKLENKISIFSNSVLTPEKRNGALKDLSLAVSHFKIKDTPLLVTPSDTYYDFSLADFIKFCYKDRSNFATIARIMPSKDEIKNRLGCPTIEGETITEFVEKPDDPPSNYAIIPFYYYPRHYIEKLSRYLEEGNNHDAPSNIISWFLKNKIRVKAFVVKGKTLDVGTVEDVKRLNEV